MKSSILPLNTAQNKLKIYSSIGGGNSFRLTNGVKVSEGTAIIGGNYYKINAILPAKESMKLLLKIIRPLPEIVVIGIGQKKKAEWGNWNDLKEEFGCSVEVSESVTAATTFNTLIDDDRSVIGIFL